MFNSIVSNFSKLSDPNFLAQAERIVTGMTGNAAFPAPWPATVPALAQIQTDLAAYQAAVTATAAGDRTRIEERKNARSTLAADLSLLAFNVQITAQGNTTLLASTGFPLRQRGVRPQVPTVPAPPAQVKLMRGPVSGSMVVSASRVPTAGSYDVQLTTADPTVEANWSDAGNFKNSRRIQLQGLTPLKTYSVRLRALGAGGYGGWTTATSVLVL